MSAPTLPLGLFAEWLANGKRGLSSEAIVEHLTGIPVGGRAYAPRRGRLDHPCDAGDLRRCVELLDRVPEARESLDKMRTASAAWAVLVDHWDELESLLRDGMKRKDGNATRQRMSELLDAVRVDQ